MQVVSNMSNRRGDGSCSIPQLVAGAPSYVENVCPDLYSWNVGEEVFSEVGYAFLAKTLLNSTVGQPLGKQFLGSLGPPAGFIS